MDHSDHAAMGHGGHGHHGGHGDHAAMGHGDHAGHATQDVVTLGLDENGAKLIGDHSHYVYTQGGHGDGVLQGGVEEVLLFKGAVTSSGPALFLACVILLVLAIVLEYLRLLAWYIESRYVKASLGLAGDSSDVMNLSQLTNKNYGTKPDSETVPVIPTTPHKRAWAWLLLGLLHCANYILATCLMLITMTFNVFIIISIGLGNAVGRLATLHTKSKFLKARS